MYVDSVEEIGLFDSFLDVDCLEMIGIKLAVNSAYEPRRVLDQCLYYDYYVSLNVSTLFV